MRRVSSALLLSVLLAAGCSGTLGRADTKPPGGASTASRSPAPRTKITVVAAGDLLVHPELTAQAGADALVAGRAGHDFTQVLAAVRPVVSRADLAICHMETPLAEPSGPFTGYPVFSVPPELADAAAWAGFDTCSTASNHSLDTGLPGIRRTLDKLDQVGLRHAGTARSAQEAARPNILDVAGVKVAQLSYAFGFNGIPRPEGQDWAANLADRSAILAEARRARNLGAEIVILSMHWGTEYQNKPNDDQLQLARGLLASPDIDLIVGHHVHVVQPFEKIGKKWVAYGMGNLTTYGSEESTQQAVVPQFTFTRAASGRWEVSDVEVHATWMQYQPAARVVDLASAVNDVRAPEDRRAALARVQEQITRYVDMRGALAAGLQMRR
ncbi:CapA family protein [Micromonospora inositola]|uniref:Poly-gamma-glutamate synthesis protein (Capsule biosynthesis protein) n=1 Tax=Micromonospora inositola TaxID=47865 RepID=A0A1C5H1H8_9ACTN|nr:CapA family protein [Micromonospora inositola]SCG39905.1 poly-gamma-glutamate synthesis protein (capsule biosynthesis protein) [Micromonospora inositola]